jgi:hypothetical protein
MLGANDRAHQIFNLKKKKKTEQGIMMKFNYKE